MPIRRALHMLAVILIVLCMVQPVGSYVAYESHLVFLRYLVNDILRMVPRAMGAYIYQNRYDFMRGLTVTTRDLKVTPLKTKDLEELKRDAYARLSRDIPYCVEAFKGGEFKLDTTASNLSGRLGLIAYNILLLNMPSFPDAEYLEAFSRTIDSLIGERLIGIWVYYDGYGNFHSLGELMERLKDSEMPKFRYIRNRRFPIQVREDVFHAFRFPDKQNTQIVMTDKDVNDIYNETLNDIADVFVYIWKCSGMDLAHPSYAAPPGTTITRVSARRSVRRSSPSSLNFAKKGKGKAAVTAAKPAAAAPGKAAAPAAPKK
jgi:hypothetical protein